MIGYRNKILQTVLFIFFLCACSTENNLFIEDFQINNDKTTQALYDIMYKPNDQTNETTLKKDYLYERFKIVHISDIHLSNWSTDNIIVFLKI